MCSVETRAGKVVCKMLITKGTEDECLLGQDWLKLNSRIGGIRDWQNQLEAESIDRMEPEQFPTTLEEFMIKNKEIFGPIDSRGCTNKTTHKIELLPNQKPIKVPVRNIPLHLRDQTREKLWELEREGIIVPSKSPWASG